MSDPGEYLRAAIETLTPEERAFGKEQKAVDVAAGKDPLAAGYRALVDVRRKFGHWPENPPAAPEGWEGDCIIPRGHGAKLRRLATKRLADPSIPMHGPSRFKRRRR